MAGTSSTGSPSPCQILVVDDDPSIRLLCATSLQKAGYRVLEAEGSSEAMTLCAQAHTPIDLLLTDLFLPPPDFQLRSSHSRYPRVNGHDLVHQVLSLKTELRLLFMSNHTLTRLSSEGITIDPKRFLHKPFSVQQLLSQVTAALTAPPIHRTHSAGRSAEKAVRWVD